LNDSEEPDGFPSLPVQCRAVHGAWEETYTYRVFRGSLYIIDRNAKNILFCLCGRGYMIYFTADTHFNHANIINLFGTHE
jgi:hypothetical protein